MRDIREAADRLADQLVTAYLQDNEPVGVKFAVVIAALRLEGWTDEDMAGISAEQFVEPMNRRIKSQHSATLKLGLFRRSHGDELIIFTMDDIERLGLVMVPKQPLIEAAAMLDHNPEEVAETVRAAEWKARQRNDG